MRLINGDALIEEHRKMWASNEWSQEEIHCSLRDIEMNVQNADEIEAIPIEWIMNFIRILDKVGTPSNMFGMSIPIIMALVDTWRENKDIKKIEDNGKN